MDATSSPLPVPDYAANLDHGVKGMKFGVPAEYFAEGLDPEVRSAIEAGIDKLRAAGAEIKNISLPHTRYAIPTYYVIATAEASANLARFDGVRYGLRAPQSDTLAAMYRRTRDLGFGAEVKRRILLGTYVLSHGYYDAYYRKAQQVRRLLAEDFLTAFREVDAILTPTAPTPAFKLGEKSDDPVAMYLADIYTVTASLAGICGVSVSVWTIEGRPSHRNANPRQTLRRGCHLPRRPHAGDSLSDRRPDTVTPVPDSGPRPVNDLPAPPGQWLFFGPRGLRAGWAILV